MFAGSDEQSVRHGGVGCQTVEVGRFEPRHNSRRRLLRDDKEGVPHRQIAGDNATPFGACDRKVPWRATRLTVDSLVDDIDGDRWSLPDRIRLGELKNNLGLTGIFARE